MVKPVVATDGSGARRAGRKAAPGAAPVPARLDTASLAIEDLAQALLERKVRPRVADIRRLAEAVVRKKERKKARKASKEKLKGKAKSNRKLSKIPSQTKDQAAAQSGPRPTPRGGRLNDSDAIGSPAHQRSMLLEFASSLEEWPVRSGEYRKRLDQVAREIVRLASLPPADQTADPAG